MSGTTKKQKPEPILLPQQENAGSQSSFGVFDLGQSNTGREAEAEATRKGRIEGMIEEQALFLPDLGAASPGVWEGAMRDAFHKGLGKFVGSIPENGGGVDEFFDASKSFASGAASSLAQTGYEQMGGVDGVIDLAREYPVPAALLAVGAAYGASQWIEGKPTLKLKVKLSPISENLSATVKHDMKTGDTGFMLRFKYEW